MGSQEIRDSFNDMRDNAREYSADSRGDRSFLANLISNWNVVNGLISAGKISGKLGNAAVIGIYKIYKIATAQKNK